MNIWVPKIKIIENTKEAIEIPGCRVDGHYEIKLIHPNGTVERGHAFHNLITDYGLDYWGVGNPIVYCAIGNAAGTPSNGNSTMFGFLQATGVTTSGVQGLKNTESPFEGYVSAIWDFGVNNTGSAKTFNNVGVGPSIGGVNLFSHALVLSSIGAPTSQTWPAGSQLTIAYRANIYPWLSDGSFTSVAIGASTYSGVIRPATVAAPDNGKFWLAAHVLGYSGALPEARAYTGAIGPMTGTPAGAYTQSTHGNTSAYVNGQHQRTGWAGWDGTQANGNINAITFGPSTMWYQISLTPTFVKQQDWYLSLNVGSGTWGRL